MRARYAEEHGTVFAIHQFAASATEMSRAADVRSQTVGTQVVNHKIIPKASKTMAGEKGTCCVCKCSLAIETGAWCSTCFDARDMHTEGRPTMANEKNAISLVIQRLVDQGCTNDHELTSGFNCEADDSPVCNDMSKWCLHCLVDKMLRDMDRVQELVKHLHETSPCNDDVLNELCTLLGIEWIVTGKRDCHRPRN